MTTRFSSHLLWIGRRPTLDRRFPLENVRLACGSLSRAQVQIRPVRAAGLLFAVIRIQDETGTVTQIGLGAAVGETALDRKIGRRALLWAGICGLLPDLDVLVPLGSAVRDFTYHRRPWHSIFALPASTPMMVYWILRIHPQIAIYRARWLWLVFLAFATHVILDCLTAYGTQIFWPLADPETGRQTADCRFVLNPFPGRSMDQRPRLRKREVINFGAGLAIFRFLVN
jgi:hypothetical protein